MTTTRMLSARSYSRVWRTRRALSSVAPQAAAVDQSSASSSSPSPPPAAARLPTRHSHKKLPLICADAQTRRDLTQQLLQAPEGSLFPYINDRDSIHEAWQQADTTVQTAEFLLRGHANTLSGTTWNRWREPTVTTASNDQVEETLQTMKQLVDRLWDEGYSYMQLRASRLEETQGPKVNAHVLSNMEEDSDDGDYISDDEEELENKQQMMHAREVFDSVEALQQDIQKFARDEGLDMDDDSSSSSDSESDSDSDNEATAAEPTYMEDFAVPGPTTHMYDTLLDAMACQSNAASVSAREAYFLFEDILQRHELDGGDASNTLLYTRPTIQSYNAAIRVAASLPYDRTDSSPTNQKHRDDAIHLAFVALDALSESQLHHRNSATYTYLLQVVSKYFPASRSRGHIARGMLLHAREQGLIDEALVLAYRMANEPSNGEEFLETLSMLEKPVPEMPHKWRANNRRWRSHAREATY